MSVYKIILNDWNMLFLFFNNSIVGGEWIRTLNVFVRNIRRCQLSYKVLAVEI